MQTTVKQMDLVLILVIIIREAGNCSRLNGIGGTIQFEASPNKIQIQ